MTDNDIRDYVRRKFGDGVMCVELTDEQIDDALLRAKMWLSQWIPTEKAIIVPLTIDTEYTMPTDCQDVVEVVYSQNTERIFDAFRWAGIELGVMDLVYPMPGGGYSELVQRLQTLELSKMVTSAERTWQWDRVRRKLILSPQGADGEIVMAFYVSDTFDSSKLRNYEMQLLLDYTFARSMETLGYIRTKFMELPSASGAITLNGDTLLANAMTLLSELEERARRLVRPAQFFVG
jgi:hypothetical protein